MNPSSFTDLIKMSLLRIHYSKSICLEKFSKKQKKNIPERILNNIEIFISFYIFSPLQCAPTKRKLSFLLWGPTRNNCESQFYHLGTEASTPLCVMILVAMFVQFGFVLKIFFFFSFLRHFYFYRRF